MCAVQSGASSKEAEELVKQLAALQSAVDEVGKRVDNESRAQHKSLAQVRMSVASNAQPTTVEHKSLCVRRRRMHPVVLRPLRWCNIVLCSCAQMRAELAQQVEELSARVERDEAALADRVTAVVRPMLRRVRDELAERQGNGVADPEVPTRSPVLYYTLLVLFDEELNDAMAVCAFLFSRLENCRR